MKSKADFVCVTSLVSTIYYIITNHSVNIITRYGWRAFNFMSSPVIVVGFMLSFIICRAYEVAAGQPNTDTCHSLRS